MCVDYRFTCTGCGHEWEQWGTGGCLMPSLYVSDNRCKNCGCQVLKVYDCGRSREEIIDFTEPNLRRVDEREQKFASMMARFILLSDMTVGTVEYNTLKAELMEDIRFVKL